MDRSKLFVSPMNFLSCNIKLLCITWSLLWISLHFYMNIISNVSPKTKEKVWTVPQNWKNGLPSTRSMMSSRHIPAIFGRKEVVGRGCRGRGDGYLCRAPWPVTRGHTLQFLSYASHTTVQVCLLTQCLAVLRDYDFLFVFLNLVLYFVSFSILIPFTSNTVN